MARDSKVWRCGKYELKFDRPRIMGVLNVTPDSFSDGGEHLDTDAAIAHGLKMLDDGADIIDVGGESTRPGFTPVDPDTEAQRGGEHLDTDAAIAHGLKMLDDGADIIDVGGESTRPGFTPVDPDTEAQRVLPVVKALARAGAIVSIDTRHVEVAKAAVRVGASIVNDVTGFTDPRMVDFVKESDCGVVIMHAGEVSEVERPRTHTAVQLDTSAAAFMAEKAREAEAAARALGATGKSKRAAKAKLISNMIQPLQPQLPLDAPAAEPAGSAPEVDPVTGTLALDMAAASVSAPAEPVPAAPDAAPAPAESPVVSEMAIGDDLASVMARSAARTGSANRTSQLRRFTLPDSAPIMRRVMGFLSDQARALIHAGVDRERICLDPGPGFGKDANEDIVIQREMGKIASLGYPTLCAVSRKRLVGAIAGVENARDRDIATFGVCLGAIEQGANIVRVHDVAGFYQFLNGFWAIARSWASCPTRPVPSYTPALTVSASAWTPARALARTPTRTS